MKKKIMSKSKSSEEKKFQFPFSS